MRTLPPSPAAFSMPETGFIYHVCRQSCLAMSSPQPISGGKIISRLRRWCRRRGRGFDGGGAVAGVHDVAGAFPRFNKPSARVRAVELQTEIVEVAQLNHQ